MSISQTQTSSSYRNSFYAQIGTQIIDTYTKSWEEFLTHIANEAGLTLSGPLSSNDNVDDNDEILQYFEGVVTKARNVDATTSEDQLTKKCLHPLVLVENKIMEDTANGITNWKLVASHRMQEQIVDEAKLAELRTEQTRKQTSRETDTLANKFRKVIFTTSLDDANRPSRRIDILCRSVLRDENPQIQNPVSHQSSSSSVTINSSMIGQPRFKILAHYDPEDSNYEIVAPNSSETQLQPWRIMPWNAITFIDIKKKKVDIKALEYIGQTGFYAESYLKVSPDRKVIFGAVTNLECILFIACVHMVDPDTNESIYFSYRSSKITTDIARELTKFMKTPNKDLGFLEAFPTDMIVPVEPLGRGSTGIVMSCKINHSQFSSDKEYAVKVSRHKVSLATEKKVLDHLNTVEELRGRIPLILDHSALDLPYPYDGHITVYDQVYERVGNLNEKDVMDIWDILDKAHSHGIIHGDVRVPNVGRDNNGRIVVLDWSAARNCSRGTVVNPSEYQDLSMFTASMRVLKERKVSRDVSIEPYDEAESLIWMYAFYKFKQNTSFMYADPRKVILSRNIISGELTGFNNRKIDVLELMKPLQENTTTNLKENIQSIIKELDQLKWRRN